jgi:hypothetical protein
MGDPCFIFNMFEWLEREILEVKTPRFHLTEGRPADPDLQDAVLGSNLPLPLSYKRFVMKFGNTRLYRLSRAGYRIGVFAGPREAMVSDGSRIYNIGFEDDASIYVKPDSGSLELPIFEFEENSEEKVADGFEQWLEASCARARKAFGKKKWREILRGPRPFSPEEEEILAVRRLIRWRVLGIDQDGDHIFEVTNGGHRSIPTLTVGIRSRDRRLNGAVHLKTASIGPGKTVELHADCYKKFAPHGEIETFALPEPQPEDRDYYWELRVKEGPPTN